MLGDMRCLGPPEKPGPLSPITTNSGRSPAQSGTVSRWLLLRNGVHQWSNRRDKAKRIFPRFRNWAIDDSASVRLPATPYAWTRAATYTGAVA
jgi:hypothetical protein